MNEKSERLPCPIADESDLIHRYVAGTLPADQVEEFEAHFVECAACQRAVREGAVLRAELRLRRRGIDALRTLAWGVPLAAAAALVVWLVLPGESQMERLGRVGAPPGFVGFPVRAATDSAFVLAERGMAAYREERYADAAALLASAVERDPAPSVYFFLGVARLLTGDADGAVTALTAALDPPDNPYAAEARLYLAKAWLRLGRPDSALVQLAAVPADGDKVHAHASALADSVRRLLE